MAKLEVGEAVLSFSFIVGIDGHDIGTWRTCELGGMDMAYRPLKVGGVNGFREQLRGDLRWKPIVLTRYVTEETNKVGAWVQSMGGSARASTGHVTACARDGSEVVTFEFYNARPVEWNLPTMDVANMGAAVEKLKIAHDGFRF
jgi:phage tail-like protein